MEARSNLRTFAITKDEAQKKFPREFLEFIEREVRQRYKWIEQRAEHLAKTSNAVARMDPLANKYDDNLTNISRKFPIATRSIITNIRKQELFNKGLGGNKKSVFQKNASEGILPAVNLFPSGSSSQSPPKKAHTNTSSSNAMNTSAASSPSRSIIRKINMSLQRASLPAGGLHEIVASSERLLQPCDRYQIEVAASAHTYAGNRPMIPVFSKPLYRSRIAALGSMRMMPTESGLAAMGEEREDPRRFQIGNRRIAILDRSVKRAKTPNPFNVVSARIKEAGKK